MFSSIAHTFDVPPNALYALRDEFLKRKKGIIDLVSGNVNAQGIQFPPHLLSAAIGIGLKKAKVYSPDPLGQLEARTALRRYYSAEGLKFSENQILITPGTSVSYWYAFKVLADAGDEILAPAPSYPLFDSIAALCGVKLTTYRLRERKRWEIDFDHLEGSITPRTKAIILISPHNPTGHVASQDEVERLVAIAARRNLPIVSDEVFSPFLFRTKRLPRPGTLHAPLVITLNGLSKMLALPGFKVGWMAVTGDPSLVKKTMKALDMISDTFLPVSEIGQFALPTLLQKSKQFQRKYVSDVSQRMKAAARLLNGLRGISYVVPEGGFFMSLRLEDEDEEKLALELLRRERVLVHPGYFYDMEGSHLAFSFVRSVNPLVKGLREVGHLRYGRAG